jgi:O-antigen/teichoic acid export membrane protein
MANDLPGRSQVPAPSTGQFARNTVLNLLGQGIPILVGVATIPLIVRRLGTERFGLLGIAWAILGTFTLFNLGLGRATTKLVAEYVARGELALLSTVFWTSLWVQLLLGVVGGIVLAVATPFLVSQVFRIPAELALEGRTAFLVLSTAIPAVTGTTALRGVLEGARRFDLANLVKLPLGASTFVIPAVCVSLGLGLSAILCLLVVAWLAAGAISLVLCMRLFPQLKERPSPNARSLGPLLVFAGWLTVSNVIAPVFLYLDRFIIGSVLTLTAVGYYTAPFEVATKLWIIPSSVATTLFPVFSALTGEEPSGAIDRLYAQSVKHLLLLVSPMVVLLVAFGGEFLSLWLGAKFAKESTLAFQVLTFGVLLNSLAWVPFSLLQGRGRADLTAKFHVAELFLYAPLVWGLVRELGIAGAAVAWAVRVAVDAVLLFGACARLRLVSRTALAGVGMSRTVVAVLSLAAVVAVIELTLHGPVRTVVVVVALVGFTFCVWRCVLSATEKAAVRVEVLRRARREAS